MDKGSQCVTFGSVADALKAKDEPDVIVLYANGRHYANDLSSLKISPSFSKVPLISILPPEVPELPARGDGADGEIVFRTPVDRGAFVAKVMSLQRRSLRRVFEILVNIRPDGSNIKYTGKSLDFSKTGMAFECSAEFLMKQKVGISFVDPKSRKRLMLDAEIIRRQPKLASGSSLYGVKFLDIPEEDINSLMNFISGNTPQRS